ncbi:hypothetical protein [Thermomonas sp.]
MFFRILSRAAPRHAERSDIHHRHGGIPSMGQDCLLTDARIEAQLAALESEMPRLQAQALNVFELANAWAVRHDAIISVTPDRLLAKVEARLLRIGIRWAMKDGARMTGQFPVLPPRTDGDAT